MWMLSNSLTFNFHELQSLMASRSFNQELCVISQNINGGDQLIQVRLKGLNTLIEYREIREHKDLENYPKE